MEYTVVRVEYAKLDDAIDTLKFKVNELLQDGWRPHGSVSATAHNCHYYTVAQAMIREQTTTKRQNSAIKINGKWWMMK